MKENSHKVNLAHAYSSAVKAHQDFAENHSLVKGATISFELVQGVQWHFDRNERGRGGIVYSETSEEDFDIDNADYNFEVNWIEYEDENYLHVDADDGCGNRHIQLVFLKSEQVNNGNF